MEENISKNEVKEKKKIYFRNIIVIIAIAFFSIMTFINNRAQYLKMKEIGEQCFEYSNNIKEITIPNSVTKLGKKCFYYCSSLTKVEGLEHVAEIGKKCFEGCDNFNQNN